MSRNKIYGIGINDSTIPVTKKLNGVVIWSCPAYKKWRSILRKCYSDTYKSKRPYQKNITMCQEWLSFSNFRSWMMSQDYENKEIDKDLFGGNSKHYSPQTCTFLHPLINNFLSGKRGDKDGNFIGVFEDNRGKFTRYIAQCNNPFTHKLEHLGVYNDGSTAYKAWKKRKSELCDVFIDNKDFYKLSDKECIALYNRYR